MSASWTGATATYSTEAAAQVALEAITKQLIAIIAEGVKRGEVVITFKPGALTSAKLTIHTGSDDGWRLT